MSLLYSGTPLPRDTSNKDTTFFFYFPKNSSSQDYLIVSDISVQQEQAGALEAAHNKCSTLLTELGD